jgi:ribosomal silencing factor RsfS
MSNFQKAVRRQARLRLALTGPSGSGKTYSALLVAKGMGGKIALIDTEKGSASLYSHLVDFDVLELQPPYTPEKFTAAIKEAKEAGYNILILDSITHEWSGVGGCLELVDEIAKAKYKGNSWSAWNEITPRHRDFIDSMLQSDMHIIATMRSKTETVQTEEQGRKTVKKLGMKSEQRDGSDYEFTTVLDIVHDGHYATASKDRTGLFTGRDPKPLNEGVGVMLMEWLQSGAAAALEHPAPERKYEKLAPDAPPPPKQPVKEPPPADPIAAKKAEMKKVMREQGLVMDKGAEKLKEFEANIGKPVTAWTVADYSSVIAELRTPATKTEPPVTPAPAEKVPPVQPTAQAAPANNPLDEV